MSMKIWPGPRACRPRHYLSGQSSIRQSAGVVGCLRSYQRAAGNMWFVHRRRPDKHLRRAVLDRRKPQFAPRRAPCRELTAFRATQPILGFVITRGSSKHRPHRQRRLPTALHRMDKTISTSSACQGVRAGSWDAALHPQKLRSLTRITIENWRLPRAWADGKSIHDLQGRQRSASSRSRPRAMSMLRAFAPAGFYDSSIEVAIGPPRPIQATCASLFAAPRDPKK